MDSFMAEYGRRRNDQKMNVVQLPLTLSFPADYFNCIREMQRNVEALNSAVLNLRQEVSQIQIELNSFIKNMGGNIAEKVNKIDDTIGDLSYNLLMANSSPSIESDYKQILEKKITEYEDDLYLKLMKKYVVDSQIALYIHVADQNYQEKDEKLDKILYMIASKLEAIGVIIKNSKQCDPFDPSCMTTGHYPNTPTTDENLDGKVSNSIHPSFIWILPSIKQQSTNLLLKEEEVTLYEYTQTFEQTEQ